MTTHRAQVIQLADALPACTTLTELELDHCDIDPAGSVHLAAAIVRQNHIKKFSLCSDPSTLPFKTPTAVGVVTLAHAFDVEDSVRICNRTHTGSVGYRQASHHRAYN